MPKSELPPVEETGGHADGLSFEEEVRKWAPHIPSWQVSECWRYHEWPDRADLDSDLRPGKHESIDLVARLHDGAFVAIECKARSGAGSITPTDVQKFGGGPAASKAFSERWMIARAHRSAPAGAAATFPEVTFKDFDAGLEEIRTAEAHFDPKDPRTAMQDEAVAKCVKVLRDGLPELAETWRGCPPPSKILDFQRLPLARP